MIFYFLLFFILFLGFLVGIIFLISYLAATSRKKKQGLLMDEITDADYSAFVRYNRGNQQDKFLKVKAFQGSGVTYVKDDQIHFLDTLHHDAYSFDLQTSNVKWVDINLVNGLVKWFSVEDDQEKYYFNIDSGMFIFNLDKSKPTTLSVFDHLRSLQNH